MKEGNLEGYKIGDFCFFGCHFFSDNGYHFLLAANGCAMIIDDILLDSICQRKPTPELQFKLVQHGLATVPGKQMFRCGKDIEIKYFIIDLTKRCNFDCIYCFRDFHNTDVIPMDMLEKILQYILNYCHRESITKIGLQMWGGEPLLALDRIEYVVNYFAHTDVKAAIDIESNASLVTDEIAQKLYGWGIRVGVSLDGTPALHNRQRRLVNGKPSAKLVESGIKNLQKYYGEDLGGITVVTKYNYRYVKEMLDYFIYKLHLTSMKFNLVRDNDHAPEHKLALDADAVCEFANELMDYLQAFHQLGAVFSEGNIEVRIKNLLQRSNMSCCISHGCQGGKKMISFDHNGNIFPCEMIDFPDEKIGSIFDEDDIETMINKAAGQNKFFLPKVDERCNGCPWWYYCQGGCSSRNRYLNKDGKIDEMECALNRSIYPRLVREILNGNIS
jgi:uncharacterized protein